MKKHLALLTAFVLFSTVLTAQNRTLKQILELQMPKTKADDYCGTRGAGVCYNPENQKYYAAFCGNINFPMAVFTAAGKRISDDNLTTMEDIRGIWYDPAVKKVMSNGYSGIGWLIYTLDSKGIPTGIDYKFRDMNQPTDQAVGAYDTRSKYVCFLQGSQVKMYENFENMFANLKDSVQIHWGRKRSQGPADNENAQDENADYNYTNVIASNITGAEFGVLNITAKQIELYDQKTGYLQQTLKLPETAVVESAFNFAFSNGVYWLFDIENRKWIGYK